MAGTTNGGRSSDEPRSFSERAKSQAASALDELVGQPSFGRLLAMTGENVAAMARITGDLADLALADAGSTPAIDVVPGTPAAVTVGCP